MEFVMLVSFFKVMVDRKEKNMFNDIFVQGIYSVLFFMIENIFVICFCIKQRDEL